MFELKILLSSGSVDHGSRIKQAWGEHVHKNINTSHPTPIPTPVSAARVSWACTYERQYTPPHPSQRRKRVVSMYIQALIHPTPAQSPRQSAQQASWACTYER